MKIIAFRCDECKLLFTQEIISEKIFGHKLDFCSSCHSKMVEKWTMNFKQGSKIEKEATLFETKEVCCKENDEIEEASIFENSSKQLIFDFIKHRKIFDKYDIDLRKPNISRSVNEIIEKIVDLNITSNADIEKAFEKLWVERDEMFIDCPDHIEFLKKILLEKGLDLVGQEGRLRANKIKNDVIERAIFLKNVNEYVTEYLERTSVK